MFESGFADSRVSLILAILLMKKSLKELASLVLHELSGSILFFFFCKMCFILSHNFLGFVMSSETKFVFNSFILPLTLVCYTGELVH